MLRFLVSLFGRHLMLHPRFAAMVFPWPTLCVNVLGCLCIGVFYTYSERWGWSDSVRLLMTTGFCGGLTTFSTFSYEGLTLLRQGLYGSYAAYAVLSIVLGLLAAALPILLSRA